MRLLATALVLGLAPLAAVAEWNAGVYLGAAATRDFTVGTGGTIEGKNLGALGVRVGYWFESASWFGLAGDISGFGVARDLQVWSGSLLFMARPPLSPGRAPRLQPYVAIGIAEYQSFLKVGETDCPLCPPGVTQAIEQESRDTAPDYRAGLAWWFGSNWGALAEYRYTSVRASFPSLPELRFQTHHLNLGFTYRW